MGALLDALGERVDANELHDQIIGADVVELADSGVVQRGDGAGLALESLGELLLQDLDGDDAIEAGIAGLVDVAHATGADGGENFVGSQSSPRRERHLDDSARFTRSKR
jgi:hypothetical protein